MMIDWGEAVQVGLVGFCVVFVVLVILALAIWLTGKLVTKFSKPEEKPAAAKAEGGSSNDKQGV
jgi:sodium pump decarboxylase gamma subunit